MEHNTKVTQHQTKYVSATTGREYTDDQLELAAQILDTPRSEIERRLAIAVVEEFTVEEPDDEDDTITTKAEATSFLEENARMVISDEKAQEVADAFGLGPIPKYLKGTVGDVVYQSGTGVGVCDLAKWIGRKLKLTITRDGSGYIGRGRSAEEDTLGVVDALRAQLETLTITGDQS